MKKGSKAKYPRRGKKITYHGRTGRPLLHKANPSPQSERRENLHHDTEKGRRNPPQIR